jgi:hypothetical protein
MTVYIMMKIQMHLLQRWRAVIAAVNVGGLH